MFLRKLVISNLVARKVRVALTVAAVALSVSLVVSVTSGYASALGVVQKWVETYYGSIDAQISRKNDPHGPVSSRVIDGLRADPVVKRADGRIEIVAPLIDKDGTALETRMATVIGIDRPRDTRIDLLKLHTGSWFDTSEGNVVVVDQALAEHLKLKVGDVIGLAGGRKLPLKIVGIVHKPEALAQNMQTVYVPLGTLQKFQGWDAGGPRGAEVNRIYVELNRGTDPGVFESRWKDELPKFDPAAKMKLTRDARDQLDKNLQGVEQLSYLGGAVSMLAAMFIVFSALSMGVSERQRTLAMLRAIGASRPQIGWLVVIEGIMLAGSGALIGAPLGWVWVKVLTFIFPDFFSAGVVISWGGVALGVGGTIITALAASLLPAWQATRIDPIEAMTPDATPPAASTPIYAAIAGLALILVDPLIFFGPLRQAVAIFQPKDLDSAVLNTKYVLHFLVGLPAVFLGFFLLGPVLVKLIERVGSPLVARMLGLRPALLRQQLSSGLWRAAGTAAALMVGLAVLVVMQIQGNSALKGWKLPNKFPDLFIVAATGYSGPVSGATTTAPSTQPAATQPSLLSRAFDFFGKKDPPAAPATGPSTQPSDKPGLLDQIASALGMSSADGTQPGVEIDRVKILEKVPGIRGNEIMPIAIASPQFGHGLGSFILTSMNPEATMFFGIDPTKAFKLMELDFRDGSANSAEQYLDHGEAIRLKKNQTWRAESAMVEIAQDGRQISKLKGAVIDQGQVLLQGLVTKSADGSYTVDPPGGSRLAIPADQVDTVEHGRFLIVTNEFKQLRGIALGDAFSLKRIDGRVVQYTIVGVVWSPGIEVMVSMFDMSQQFDQRTASSVFGSVRDAKDDFGVERIYIFAANVEPGVDKEVLLKSIRKLLRSNGMTAGDVRDIKEKIEEAFTRVLLLLSTVAFAALAVASLGVTNTVMAGIRTRRWHFGVLRSIGLTRGQLLRLILAEAILLGLIGCALGLGAGSIMSLDARALQVAVTGYNPPLSIPWNMMALGVGSVLFIALAASLWPAIDVARREPLGLLQAGRAMT